MKRILIIIFIAVFSAFSICGCRKTQKNPVPTESEADKLNEALNLKGKLIKGKMPSPDSFSLKKLWFISYPATVEVAAGVTVYIPYSTNDNQSVAKLYMQVEGATAYWEISAVVDTAIIGFNLEVNIPGFAQKGTIKLVTAAATQSGNVSEPITTDALVTDLLSCGGGEFEGSVGITVKRFNLGHKKGWVTISYDTYTIPDRVDISYNKKWIKSTAGDNIPDLYQPNCGGYPANGFVSGTGTLKFEYDPTIDTSIDVYVTGCDNSTLWVINVGCPNDTFYAGLPDCPCNYTDAKAKVDAGTLELGGVWVKTPDIIFDELAPIYHYGAKYEFRWVPDNNYFTIAAGKPGQQCNYDASGYLITGGIAAGSPDKVSPGVYATHTYTLFSPSHNEEDIIPWKTIECWRYLIEWKANNGKGCYNNVITDIAGDTMKVVVGNMSCEKVTNLFKAVNECSTVDYYLLNFFKSGSSSFLKLSYIKEKLKAVKSYWFTTNYKKEYYEAVDLAIANIP